jgi:hypothetical protein
MDIVSPVQARSEYAHFGAEHAIDFGDWGKRNESASVTQGKSAYLSLHWPSCSSVFCEMFPKAFGCLMSRKYSTWPRLELSFQASDKACLDRERASPYDVLPWSGNQKNEIYGDATMSQTGGAS